MEKQLEQQAPAPEAGQAVKKPKKKLSMAQKNAIAGYLWISPFIIGFFAFLLVPLFESLQMSFSKVTVDLVNHGFSKDWVGLKNYSDAINVDPEYKRILLETLASMAYEIVAVLIFSYFVAVLLNQKFAGRSFVRAVFFLPVILSSGIIVGLESSNTLLQGMQDVIKDANAASNSVTGVLEDILVNSTGGDGSGMSDFLGEIFAMVNSVYDIAIASGIQIIIFLSGLQTIPASMYEASKIEGATAWESFWKITFPMTSSLILVNIVYTVIDFCTRSDNEVMTKISDTMTGKMDYGATSAMAWLYFLIVVAALGLVSAIISKWVYYYE